MSSSGSNAGTETSASVSYLQRRAVQTAETAPKLFNYLIDSD